MRLSADERFNDLVRQIDDATESEQSEQDAADRVSQVIQNALARAEQVRSANPTLSLAELRAIILR